MRSRRDRFRAVLILVTAALSTAAVANELRKPAAERTWNGRLGPIPYDFRPPTLSRLKRSFWNPEGPLFPPRVGGVGWGLNIGRIVREIRTRTSDVRS